MKNKLFIIAYILGMVLLLPFSVIFCLVAVIMPNKWLHKMEWYGALCWPAMFLFRLFAAIFYGV